MMNILTLKAGRLTLRRAGQTKQLLLKPAKQRHKSTTTPTGNGGCPLEDVKTVPTPNVIPPLPLWQRLGPLSTVFTAYGKAQRSRPYMTQLCSSLVIYFCADLAAQNIGDEGYNPWRTVRNMIIGGICAVPSYKWYIYRLKEPLLPLSPSQVHLSRALFQLPLRASFPRYQSRRQPNSLHSHLQQLFLWHAIPSLREWRCRSMGEDREDGSCELCQ